MSRSTRPLYFRLLRVRHLKVRPWLAFLLFEGSFGLGILLALADIVNYWGIIVIPVAVAAMVKINDMITGAMLAPLADAQLRTPRILQRRASGKSPVPRTGRMTAPIDDDDAVADPDARPDGVVRGVARARYRGRAPARPPHPGVDAPEPPVPDQVPLEPPADQPSLDAITAPDRADAGDRIDGQAPAPGQPRTDSAARPDGAQGRVRGNQGRFT